MPKIGEIWLAALPPVNIPDQPPEDVVGHEQSGPRPTILLAIYEPVEMCMAVLLTSNLGATRFYYTRLIKKSISNGLASDSVALVFHTRPLSYKRLVRKLGSVEVGYYTDILRLLKEYLNL